MKPSADTSRMEWGVKISGDEIVQIDTLQPSFKRPEYDFGLFATEEEAVKFLNHYHTKVVPYADELRNKILNNLAGLGVGIGFDVSPSSDTHGLHGERLVFTFRVDGRDYTFELAAGWCV